MGGQSWPSMSGIVPTVAAISWRRAHDLARRQSDVLTAAQARSCGLTPRQIRHRVLFGEWTRWFPGVYLIGRDEPDDRARARMAVAWAGPRAVLSGPSAGYWWGLLDWAPAVTEITLPRAVRRRPPDATVRVRRRDLAAVDRVTRGGVAVTSVSLTVLDTVAAVGREPGAELLDRALQTGRVRWDDLVVARHRHLGAHGHDIAGALMAAAALGARSEAERRAVGLLRAAAIDGWTLDHPIAVNGVRYVLDIAFPAYRVAVEIDGWAWHTTVDRFRRDRVRQNALTLAGWTVLRFSWHDLTCRPTAVVGAIRRATQS